MRRTLITTLALLAVGCGAEDFTGDYSVNTANGPNECGVQNWDASATSEAIPVRIQQTDGDAEVDVMGLAAIALVALSGSSVFDASVSGNSIDGEIIGTQSFTQDSCTFTTTVDLHATLDGDFLEGTLTVIPRTNMHPDCGALDTCDGNVISFNGSRPPTE